MTLNTRAERCARAALDVRDHVERGEEDQRAEDDRSEMHGGDLEVLVERACSLTDDAELGGHAGIDGEDDLHLGEQVLYRAARLLSQRQLGEALDARGDRFREIQDVAPVDVEREVVGEGAGERALDAELIVRRGRVAVAVEQNDVHRCGPLGLAAETERRAGVVGHERAVVERYRPRNARVELLERELRRRDRGAEGESLAAGLGIHDDPEEAMRRSARGSADDDRAGADALEALRRATEVEAAVARVRIELGEIRRREHLRRREGDGLDLVLRRRGSRIVRRATQAHRSAEEGEHGSERELSGGERTHGLLGRPGP